MPLPAPSGDGVCLVTGASAGIGRELARGLARRGRGVALVARREARLLDLAEELRREHGVRAEAFPCDLTDADARAALVGDVAARGLRVDVLVNNAGFAPAHRVAEADPAREVALVRLNVEAVADLCVRCVGPMVGRGAGGVLNVASTAAFAPTPNQAGYGASKAFVLSYTDALAAEVAGTGVHVTALCPGPVPTEIFEAEGGVHPVDRLPPLFWREAPDVAEEGLRALEDGRTRAFKGLPNRLSALAGQHAPRSKRALGLVAAAFTTPSRPAKPRR